MNTLSNNVLLCISALSLMACSQGNFSADSIVEKNASSQSSSYQESSGGSSNAAPSSSGSSVSSGSSGSASSSSSSDSSTSSGSGTGTASNSGSGVMPTKKCANNSVGGLDFRIDVPVGETYFLSGRLLSVPTTQKSYVETYSIYETASGLEYDLESAEPYVDGEADDKNFRCGITYSEVDALAKRKGYANINAAIPNVVFKMWRKQRPDNAKLVGYMMKNPYGKEWATQCF